VGEAARVTEAGKQLPAIVITGQGDIAMAVQAIYPSARSIVRVITAVV
jgi:FixJ family two-component response regulator